MKLFTLFFTSVLLVTCHLSLVTPVSAVTNPLSVPNNKYGIHIISATRDEASEAARLVNTNGDWGYITVLAESGDRNEVKWQEFFSELRRRHLIPLVRLATKPDNGNWKRPYDGEEIAWADFLDRLNWPTKNRFIILYNEPNHGSEWGGFADPEGFAVATKKTIDALRQKSADFFILNAGFDASAPNNPPAYMDQEEFMKRMDTAVPGIFDKFDGWVSHSYPNPGFIGKPNEAGRGTVRTWEWEQQLLNRLGVTKVLPIFITETGWKHSEGVVENKSFPSPEVVASYYKDAFSSAWANSRIVAVTPFLLNYQEPPFDHFSFKVNSQTRLASDASRDYHLPYYVLQDAQKQKGRPLQDESAALTKIGIEKDGFTNYFDATSSGTFASFAYDEPYKLVLTFKNTGQSIWGDGNEMALILFGGGPALEKTRFDLQDKKIEPGQEVTFEVPLLPLKGGAYKMLFNFYSGTAPLMEKDYPFEIEVKAPVFLKISASLKWKKNFAGEYLLSVLGQLRYALSTTQINTVLNNEGKSETLETKYLLPDQQYIFTLEKPYYKPKTISQTIAPGTNEINFGELQPDIRSAILKPIELWKLLPWSN
ncbi:hypothetical protein HYW44_04460 [Candidatus Daviesbacteria bacterium]|nr:hypothetical protein [Candidatus Daviesbacteria bacterium]